MTVQMFRRHSSLGRTVAAHQRQRTLKRTNTATAFVRNQRVFCLLSHEKKKQTNNIRQTLKIYDGLCPEAEQTQLRIPSEIQTVITNESVFDEVLYFRFESIRLNVQINTN